MSDRKEQLAQLEAQARERFLQQQSADEIKTYLKENGAYQRDADRIYREVKREIMKSHTDQAEERFLNGATEQEVRDQLQDQLLPDQIESVISSATQFVRRKIEAEVHQMVDEERNWEEVVEKYKNLPIVTEQDLATWADARYAKNQEAEAQEAQHGRGIVVGIVVLLAGVGLTLESYFSAASQGGSYSIWYGLIVGGIVLIGQGIWARYG